MQRSLEVLVAEHDRDVAEGLSDILDMAGHKVHRAFTAESAYELLRDYDFHVAFVNVKKPGLSSLECFAELRKIKPDANLILMSAHTIDQLTSQITDGGPVKVVRPPLSFDDVVEALNEIGATGTLLIEDAPADFAPALQAGLKERDANLEIARDRTEALAKLGDEGWDVLLLDLHLTECRSLEVFLDLRHQGHSRPTIIFQSYAGAATLGGGALETDIFFKPFDPAQMVQLLENIAELQDGEVTPETSATPTEDKTAKQEPPPTAAPEPDSPPTDPPAEAAQQTETIPATSLAVEQTEPVKDSAPSFASEPGSEPAESAGTAVDLGSPPPFADDLPAHGFVQGDRDDAAPMPPAPSEADVPVFAEATPETTEPAAASQTPTPDPEPAPQAAEPAAAPKKPDTTTIWPDNSASQTPPPDPEPAPQAAEPAAAPKKPDITTIWPDNSASHTPPPDPEPAPQAAEPAATSKKPETTAIWSEDSVNQTPPPDPEPTPQTAEPAAAPEKPETTTIWSEESAGEAKLPAGVGISADQLEQAVNQPEETKADAQVSTPADQATPPDAGIQEARVLVVDDDHDMAEGLAEILEDCGLNVKVAHTSESAIAALDDFEAQIALLDIQLGKNSGLDLIPDLQQKCPNLIVVMVTAQTDQQSAITALRNGAFDYLNKPLHPQELLAAMDRCFDELAKRAGNAPASQAPKADEGGLEEAASEYMAKLSHKLRTPLNAVVGFSEILSEEMLGPLGSTQYVDYAHDIKEASKSLINVIDHFEDIDADESGKVEINEEEVDLSRVIFSALKMIQPAVDAGKLTVEIKLAEIPVFMVGDSHKLTQIMLSLLTNAVKFTPSEGKIQFTQSRDDAGGIVIEIIDTGVGIAEEVIIEALSSVIEGDGGLDPEFEGGGLSLPLATSMAELHGGKLTLDSEVGEGTTATLVLPPERNIAPKRAAAV